MNVARRAYKCWTYQTVLSCRNTQQLHFQWPLLISFLKREWIPTKVGKVSMFRFPRRCVYSECFNCSLISRRKSHKGRMLECSERLKARTLMILNPNNGEVKHETTSQIGAIGIFIRVHHYVLLCIYSPKKRLPTTELTDCASTFGCRERPDALSCTGNYCHGGWWRMVPRKSCWNAFKHLINWNLTSTPEFTGKFIWRFSLNAHRISEVWKNMEVSDRHVVTSLCLYRCGHGLFHSMPCRCLAAWNRSEFIGCRLPPWTVSEEPGKVGTGRTEDKPHKSQS